MRGGCGDECDGVLYKFNRHAGVPEVPQLAARQSKQVWAPGEKKVRGISIQQAAGGEESSQERASFGKQALRSLCARDKSSLTVWQAQQT